MLLPATQDSTIASTLLTSQQRAWVALYTLQAGLGTRAEVLRQNAITEADLADSVTSWMQLQTRARMRVL